MYVNRTSPHSGTPVRIGVCVCVCAYISCLWGQLYVYTPTLWVLPELWGQKSRPHNYIAI